MTIQPLSIRSKAHKGAPLGLTIAAIMMLSAAPAAAQDGDDAADAAGQPDDLVSQIFRPGTQDPTAENDAEDTAPEPAPAPEPVWSTKFASNLLKIIEGIDKEGLKPSDYKPKELASAISKGESFDLDNEANRAFTWLIEDMRDGRTPDKVRRATESYVDDPDAKDMPTKNLLAKAVKGGDIAAILESVAPMHADYAALREELAALPATSTSKRKHIVANMDRWRWFQRDLGPDYLHTNIPEYRLRFVINNQQIETYKTIVGTAKNSTPQLAEMITGIVYNPTWTVPQSIVKGEGLGQRVLNNPAWAARKGYKATKGANGYIGVVQAPGLTNALGHVKIHMPNRHAIFFHDTPSRGLFGRANRALSHGCIRTERAMELAMTIALVRGDIPIKKSVATQKALKYKLLPIKRELPAYLTYLTRASDINGKMRNFTDVYGRDSAVHKALASARPSSPVVSLAARPAKDKESNPRAIALLGK